MLDKFDQKQLDNLEGQIDDLIDLIDEYDSIISTEPDPATRDHYEKKAKRLKGRLKELRDQYDALKAKASSVQQIHLDTVAVRLDSIDKRLERLSGDVVAAKWAILERFDESERTLINSIVSKLSTEQMRATNAVLEAIDDQRVDHEEIEGALRQLQELLAQIDAQLDEELHPSLDYQVKTAAKVVSDTTLDVRHKIKTTIPIIPLLVTYENEFTLGSGANISNLWERIVRWWKGT